MIKAAILAGNNHAIPHLVHLLHTHPDVELTAYISTAHAGRRLDNILPAMTGETDLVATQDTDLTQADILFIAGAPGDARTFLKNTDIPADLRIIDMTGDYTVPDDTHNFVTGIAELNRKAMVRGATHVSLPHPATLAIVLGLLPLAKNLMITSAVHTHILSNDPQAPQGSITSTALSEKIAAEVSHALTSLQTSFNRQIEGTMFTGNLPDGTTAVTQITSATDIDELTRLYTEYYDDHNFTYLINRTPDTADVRGTNKCFVHLHRTGNTLTVTTALDTAVKGTAGNAIHAMNLLFGLMERVGL